MLEHASEQRASDIHLEPLAAEYRIRYRQDGLLYTVSEMSHTLATRLITRLKVIAKLDIAERRLPQDGRFHSATLAIDIRMNCTPMLLGEKVVLRLLNLKLASFPLTEMGLTREQMPLFLRAIEQPQGLILVSGPTGSGKTVTLYSALQHLNTPEKNISTVEDPIEIQLPGVNQAAIHPKIGLDFATLLRTFLRQDPDIIMVGEIRDRETAETAMHAAQTGHLVYPLFMLTILLKPLRAYIRLALRHTFNAFTVPDCQSTLSENTLPPLQTTRLTNSRHFSSTRL